MIVLNSHCSGAGGCSSTTPQGQFLRNELQTHSNVCTLAYWHVPLYSSGGRDDSTYRTFWDALYQYNADLVLSGHDHTYERFAPQTPNGAVDNVRGIRQFVVGTGGANHTSFVTTMANSQVRDDQTVRLPQAHPAPDQLRLAVRPGARQDLHRLRLAELPRRQRRRHPAVDAHGLDRGRVGTEQGRPELDRQHRQPGVEGYRIRRNGSLIATITTGTSYSDTTANPATTYSYTVDAYDVGLNYSPQSAPAAATTPPDTVAPTAPSNLTAADVAASQVRLTWTASTDNVGVDRYRIFRDGLEIGTSVTPSYTDSTVEPLTPYSYYVRAYDVSNNPRPRRTRST